MSNVTQKNETTLATTSTQIPASTCHIRQRTSPRAARTTELEPGEPNPHPHDRAYPHSPPLLNTLTLTSTLKLTSTLTPTLTNTSKLEPGEG